MLKYLGGGCVLLLLALLLGAYLCLRASLPALEGRVSVSGLIAPVAVTRDARGVPDPGAESRRFAWATGSLHAQDRFFEMDLSRRRPPGNSPGSSAASRLKKTEGAPGSASAASRVRSSRRRIRSSAGARAYTRGVNAGLARLRARPWEYWLLGSRRRVAHRGLDPVSYATWWELHASHSGARSAARGRCAPRRSHCTGGWKRRRSSGILPALTGMPPIPHRSPREPGAGALPGALDRAVPGRRRCTGQGRPSRRDRQQPGGGGTIWFGGTDRSEASMGQF